MTILETTQATFHQDVEGDTPVLVDFWAPWCAPCLALAPHLETLAANHAGRLKVLKLNVDEAPGRWQHFGVRAIPTLAFYSAGKEYGRLVGPSTMRLQLMVEKWLGELGLVVPALQRASPETRNAPLSADAPDEKWNSFGGDVAVKKAGIARLRDCSQEEAYQPSRQLAGDEAQFEAIVGVPMALGDLLGMLYWLQSQNDEKTARAQTLEIVDAMPVGANLGAVTAKVLYDLLYLSPWAISQYRQNDVARTLNRKIEMLHQRQHAGASVMESDWEALQREAVLATGSGLGSSESEELEHLAVPLLDADMVRHVLPLVTEYAVHDYRQYPDWSEAEAAQVAAMSDEDYEQTREALGGPPKNGEAARDEWISQLSEGLHAREVERRKAHPVLWERYDAWCIFKQETMASIGARTGAVLLSLLRTAGK